ncbi:MAG: fumarylacetoacetate hydrolase family protein [Deltaproteobacteria bacterium]|nr:fumarylacetoacetate hydrolase family protein [Deltaproteobacteria bacterium]
MKVGGASVKFVTFTNRGEERGTPRLGVMIAEDSILDLQGAAVMYCLRVQREKNPGLAAATLIPGDMCAFLGRGEEGMDFTRQVLDFIRTFPVDEKKGWRGRQGETLIFSRAEVQLHAPVPRPGKIIAMGLNFQSHVAENKTYSTDFPVGFLKASSALIGADEPVPYPRSTEKLDYEVELAIVIGKKGKDIPKEKAFEYVAGYSVFNDLSARDIQAREMKRRHIFLCKSLDAMAPMGPYLVTKDEVADPHNLMMELYVNDEKEPRQKASTGEMTFKIPEIIEYWSQMTLEPGDIITSGTPAGIALFHEPDPTPWFLKPGDTVEARIEKLGALRNRIV